MSENNERELPERVPREMHTGEFDITNRDPKKINEDVVTVHFEDVIAEPDDIRSLTYVWKISHFIFRMTKRCIYCILTAILGLPLSLFWALLFAFLSFSRIWAVAPCFKSCHITYKCLCRPWIRFVRGSLNPFLKVIMNLCIGVKEMCQRQPV